VEQILANSPGHFLIVLKLPNDVPQTISVLRWTVALGRWRHPRILDGNRHSLDFGKNYMPI
jgi:hypothetical protein